VNAPIELPRPGVEARSRGPFRAGPAGLAAARFFRSPDWWSSKLPPLLAFAYLFLSEPSAPPPAAAALLLALFLATAACTAAWGHFLNDLADAPQDRLLGRISGAATLGRRRATAVVVAGLALAAAPWLWLPASVPARTAFGLELALLAAYALPPLRLKERGAAGVIADALYGHALPLAITLGLFGAASAAPLAAVPAALLFAWKLFQGLCGALASQIADRKADRRSRTRTPLAAGGALAAHRLLLRFLLPAQLLVFVAALLALLPRWPWLLPAYALFLVFRLAQIHLRWHRGMQFYRRGYPGYALLNDFHERWLPLVALVLLVARDAWFAPFAIAHLALFRSGLGDLWRGVRERPSPA
jgi:1,4-dihydroxy-2-naphthoate octaprenyltransferase